MGKIHTLLATNRAFTSSMSAAFLPALRTSLHHHPVMTPAISTARYSTLQDLKLTGVAVPNTLKETIELMSSDIPYNTPIIPSEKRLGYMGRLFDKAMKTSSAKEPEATSKLSEAFLSFNSNNNSHKPTAIFLKNIPVASTHPLNIPYSSEPEHCYSAQIRTPLNFAYAIGNKLGFSPVDRPNISPIIYNLGNYSKGHLPPHVDGAQHDNAPDAFMLVGANVSEEQSPYTYYIPKGPIIDAISTSDLAIFTGNNFKFMVNGTYSNPRPIIKLLPNGDYELNFDIDPVIYDRSGNPQYLMVPTSNEAGQAFNRLSKQLFERVQSGEDVYKFKIVQDSVVIASNKDGIHGRFEQNHVSTGKQRWVPWLGLQRQKAAEASSEVALG